MSQKNAGFEVMAEHKVTHITILEVETLRPRVVKRPAPVRRCGFQDAPRPSPYPLTGAAGTPGARGGEWAVAFSAASMSLDPPLAALLTHIEPLQPDDQEEGTWQNPSLTLDSLGEQPRWCQDAAYFPGY